MPHSLRRRRKIVAALKLPGVDQLETEIEERGVSIQKARHTMLALQKMSLATFHNYNIELGLHFMCMSRLYALYFMLHTSYSMCMYLLRKLYTSHVHYAVGSLPLANNAMHSPSSNV